MPVDFENLLTLFETPPMTAPLLPLPSSDESWASSTVLRPPPGSGTPLDFHPSTLPAPPLTPVTMLLAFPGIHPPLMIPHPPLVLPTPLHPPLVVPPIPGFEQLSSKRERQRANRRLATYEASAALRTAAEKDEGERAWQRMEWEMREEKRRLRKRGQEEEEHPRADLGAGDKQEKDVSSKMFEDTKEALKPLAVGPTHPPQTDGGNGPVKATGRKRGKKKRKSRPSATGLEPGFGNLATQGQGRERGSPEKRVKLEMKPDT